MPAPVDRHEEMIQDTLTRVGALGLPERQIERECGLPQAFLAKTRAGKNRKATALESWAKIRRWLVSKGALREEGPKTSPAVSAPAAPGSTQVPPDIAQMFLTVKSADDLLGIDTRVAARTALGEIDTRLSEVLQAWSRELRQVLELQDEHQAREELLNLVPMTADQAESFWNAQEAKGVKPLAPGEGARPPEKS